MMKPLKKKANGVNDSNWTSGRVASGRSPAKSLQNQQNPSLAVECLHYAKTYIKLTRKHNDQVDEHVKEGER